MLQFMPPSMVFNHPGLCPPGRGEGRNPYFWWDDPGGGT